MHDGVAIILWNTCFCNVQVSEGVAATYDCTAQVEFSGKQGKPVINDESIYKIVKQSAEGLVGKEHFKYLHDPTMASEDFCYLAGMLPLSLQP